MQAYVQHSVHPDAIDSFVQVWLGTEEETLMLRYARGAKGTVKVVDLLRFSPEFRPWEWSELVGRPTLSQLEGMADDLERVVKKIRQAAAQARP